MSELKLSTHPCTTKEVASVFASLCRTTKTNAPYQTGKECESHVEFLHWGKRQTVNGTGILILFWPLTHIAKLNVNVSSNYEKIVTSSKKKNSN